MGARGARATAMLLHNHFSPTPCPQSAEGWRGFPIGPNGPHQKGEERTPTTKPGRDTREIPGHRPIWCPTGGALPHHGHRATNGDATAYLCPPFRLENGEESAWRRPSFPELGMECISRARGVSHAGLAVQEQCLPHHVAHRPLSTTKSWAVHPQAHPWEASGTKQMITHICEKPRHCA